MRIVFFGTPDFAIPSLDALLGSDYDLLKVVTNPDKKSGRGLKHNSSPVSTFCKINDIDCLYCSDFEDGEIYDELKSMNPDLFVVVAFKILPEKIINIPKYGSVNLHPSLLPKYRGSSPIQYAILNGEIETGVTIFRLNKQVDSGHIVAQDKYVISDEINFSELYIELSNFGAQILMNAIGLIDSGNVKYIPQKEYDILSDSSNKITYAKKINIQDCRIDWNMSAIDINNKIRAFSKKPGAFTILNNKKIKILKSTIYKDFNDSLTISECISFRGLLLVGTRDFPIQIQSLQIEGKKEITGEDFINSTMLAKKNKAINFG